MRQHYAVLLADIILCLSNGFLETIVGLHAGRHIHHQHRMLIAQGFVRNDVRRSSCQG